jgi:predicted O-methyltransferase YrrM
VNDVWSEARRLVPSSLKPVIRRLIYGPGNLTGVRRRRDYDRRLLVNPRLVEAEEQDDIQFSVGYPAWNLLYYALLCSLPVNRSAVVLETGTNIGLSTIVLAQAVKDGGQGGTVHTVEIDPERASTAKENVAAAGLSEFVHFHVGDSTDELRRICLDNPRIDFAFLDARHDFSSVISEFRTVVPRVKAARGMVCFDNTLYGGVAVALRYIRIRYSGNMVEFPNCSWSPPGSAIWQPRRPRIEQ